MAFRRRLVSSPALQRWLSTSTSTSSSSTARSVVRKRKNPFVAVGLPFLLFVVGGFALLTQFVEGKYEARDHVLKSQSTRAFDLEQEHKKMTEKLILDDFEIKPVPQPEEGDPNAAPSKSS